MSNHPLPYRTYAQYLASRFGTTDKIQKIGVTTGHSCPNRDGTIGHGGCAYCNNASFSPDYVNTDNDIARTIRRGMDFFARKYPAMRYLAYFQSYTNTHGASEDELMGMYMTAASVPGVIGVIIGTRPDCLPDSLLERLTAMNRNVCPVGIEFGAESSHNSTLARVNRGHTWDATVDAVLRTAAQGIAVGLHFIMGLPGEDQDMMLETVRRAIQLPIDTLKFHQLQIIRHTPMAAEYADYPERFDLFTPERYINLCRRIIHTVNSTRPDIAIERFVSQSPDNLLIAPRWGLKNHEFTDMLRNPGPAYRPA